MGMRHIVKGLVVCLFLMVHAAAWAAHPLITDDAGTQGQGKFQIEITGQYDEDKASDAGASVKSTGVETAATLSYGLFETADLVLAVPYSWAKVKQDGATVYDEDGFADMAFDVKWRFFERDGISLAFKPGLRIPTGSDERGLGAGRAGYQAFLIGSLETGSWGFHANLGYIGNENKVEEEKNLWHASLAATCEIVKDLTVVGNVGMERNTDKGADDDPAFLIGGLVYSLSENIDIDAGVKCGLNDDETDWSAMAGVAFRF